MIEKKNISPLLIVFLLAALCSLLVGAYFFLCVFCVETTTLVNDQISVRYKLPKTWISSKSDSNNKIILHQKGTLPTEERIYIEAVPSNCQGTVIECLPILLSGLKHYEVIGEFVEEDFNDYRSFKVLIKIEFPILLGGVEIGYPGILELHSIEYQGHHFLVWSQKNVDSDFYSLVNRNMNVILRSIRFVDNPSQ